MTLWVLNDAPCSFASTVPSNVTYNLLTLKGVLDYVQNMYELYHVEGLSNAFADLDARLAG